VRAIVEVDGAEREMEFLANNLAWAASSIAELYKSRRRIAVFFKKIENPSNNEPDRHDAKIAKPEIARQSIVLGVPGVLTVHCFRGSTQTPRLCDFLGHNKNAVPWQVWTALILYVLPRFLAFAHGWRRGFKRFFRLLRSSVWDGVWVAGLASLRGTAGGAAAIRASREQLYLPGFGPQWTRS